MVRTALQQAVDKFKELTTPQLERAAKVLADSRQAAPDREC